MYCTILFQARILKFVYIKVVISLKQYGIYCVNGKGKPFMISFFDNALSAEWDLHQAVLQWDKYNFTYYIDNDFFKNIYSRNEARFYRQIKVREVSEWQQYFKE